MEWSQKNTKYLSYTVYARLLNTHLLQAVPCPKAINRPLSPGAQQGLLKLYDASNGLAHFLVFTRVRISGVVVYQTRIDIGDDTFDCVYVDDGTGIVPFILRQSNRRNNSKISDISLEGLGDQESESEMRTRVLAAVNSQGSLHGRSVEVLGHVSFAGKYIVHVDSPELQPNFPNICIKCTHVNIKSDAMSEVAGVLDTIFTYKYYFPGHSLAHENINHASSNDMNTQLSLANSLYNGSSSNNHPSVQAPPLTPSNRRVNGPRMSPISTKSQHSDCVEATDKDRASAMVHQQPQAKDFMTTPLHLLDDTDSVIDLDEDQLLNVLDSLDS
ncbi:hypothetical protein BX070DRAFT_7340 [Coemansia spiralis]|nr:hypothetical protein BX070DRAFT_7340 [Coemansia spiralis]